MPEYRSGAHTHFAYLADFIKEISKDFDIFLLIEKGEKPESNLGCERVQITVLKIPIVRFLEIKARLLYARLLGYRNFYVHYSFFSALAASFLGRTFYWNCGEPWKYKRSFLRESMERLTYRLVTYLVTGTEGLKREYARRYNLPLQKIKVMPNWIDLADSKWQIANSDRQKTIEEIGIKENQKVVLFVHRLSRRKGAHYLPEIVRGLKDENIVTVIVGGGPEQENIRLQITNYSRPKVGIPTSLSKSNNEASGQLQDKVRFLGWVPHDEAMKLFQIADVFIMPSDEEGFPHVLLEAMAVRVPYVAARVGGVEEITPPELQPYLVSAGDVPAIVRAVRTLLKLSIADREKLTRAEANWVERFRLERIVGIFKKTIGVVE